MGPSILYDEGIPICLRPLCFGSRRQLQRLHSRRLHHRCQDLNRGEPCGTRAILVGGLCPSAEDVAQCEANLPQFWNMIAALLWPGYWDPTAEWMCADICAAPEDTVMTCDDCKMGIQAAIDQLLEEGTIATIVDTLTPEICKDNPTEECPASVDAVITQGLPLLAAASDASGFGQACEAAVPGTCPARKHRLF